MGLVRTRFGRWRYRWSISTKWKMARKPNYGFEKRQKELKREQKRKEKEARKQQRRQGEEVDSQADSANLGNPPAADSE